MTDEIEVLRALAHPVRWGILERLAEQTEICACDFTEFFQVSQPTISAHLKALRQAGLVTAQRRGTTICYSVARDRLGQLVARLGALAAAPAPGGVAASGEAAASGAAPTSGEAADRVFPRSRRTTAMASPATT
jgi:ArsR family transcriptional regulator, arsenate/arsenite/antimonite-responsive transcriptional repressor